MPSVRLLTEWYSHERRSRMQMKYVLDDSTTFWAVGVNQGVVACRAERCGKEVTMTVPLENCVKGEVGFLLCCIIVTRVSCI